MMKYVQTMNEIQEYSKLANFFRASQLCVGNHDAMSYTHHNVAMIIGGVRCNNIVNCRQVVSYPTAVKYATKEVSGQTPF